MSPSSTYATKRKKRKGPASRPLLDGMLRPGPSGEVRNQCEIESKATDRLVYGNWAENFMVTRKRLREIKRPRRHRAMRGRGTSADQAAAANGSVITIVSPRSGPVVTIDTGTPTHAATRSISARACGGRSS